MLYMLCWNVLCECICAWCISLTVVVYRSTAAIFVYSTQLSYTLHVQPLVCVIKLCIFTLYYTPECANT